MRITCLVKDEEQEADQWDDPVGGLPSEPPGSAQRLQDGLEWLEDIEVDGNQKEKKKKKPHTADTLERIGRPCGRLLPKEWNLAGDCSRIRLFYQDLLIGRPSFQPFDVELSMMIGTDTARNDPWANSV